MAQTGPRGMPVQPGQQPSPQQLQAMQQQFFQEAQRQGITPQQLADKMKADMQAKAQQQQAQQQQNKQGSGQQGQQQGQAPPNGAPVQMMQQQQQVPIQPGPPKPEALALAKFLKNQPLKARPCILQEKRREMFKVKRALRALQSPAYTRACAKNPSLPQVSDRPSAEAAFRLLPMSMLALRVSRAENPNAPKKKAPPGQKASVWTVKVEPQQDAADQTHYVWFYEGSQWRQKAYALAALLGVIGVVLYPLWPFWAKKGVWYLSMGSLGLLGAFFGLAVVRLILFLVTVSVGPQPGVWIFPNLFEDVGFFDSFKPGWDWRETKESAARKKAERKEKRRVKREKRGLGGEKKGEGKAKKKGKEANEVVGTQDAGAVQKALNATVEEVND